MAVDVDEWAFHNAVENVESNGVKVAVRLGDAAVLAEEKPFDVILANINRNVLLADMKSYVADMQPGATLLMSGFYEEDVPSIRSCADSLGLQYVTHRSQNNWVVIKFRKL